MTYTPTPTQSGPAAGDATVWTYANDWRRRYNHVTFITDDGAKVDGTTDDTDAIRAANLRAKALGPGGAVIFPPGTTVFSIQADEYGLLISDDVTFEGMPGATVKLADSTGNYKAIIGPESGSNDRARLVNLTIDCNEDNETGGAAVGVDGNQRWGAYFVGDDIEVISCHFKDHDGINTVYVTGSRPTVRDCDFTEIGGSTDRDHSTVYFGTDRGVCVDNNFKSAGAGGAGLSARAAIEVHGPGNRVTGNDIDGYQWMINVVGTATPADSALNVITGNTGDNLASGVMLWSYVAAPLKQTIVAFNEIRIDRDTWFGNLDLDTFFGIGCDQTATADFTDVKVIWNTIVYNSFTDVGNADDIDDCGLQFRENTGTFDLVRCDFTDNTIVGAPAAGMLFRVATFQTRIARNRVIDPVQSGYTSLAALYKSGMVIDQDHTDLVIEENWFIDTQGTATLTNAGIDMDNIGTVTRGWLGRNHLQVADATATPLLYRSATDSDKFDMPVKEILFASTDTTTSVQPTFEDIAGASTLTVRTGDRVRVTIGAQLSNSTTAYTYLAPDVSGATTTAASVANSTFFYSSGANVAGRAERTMILTVTPGSNVFKPQIAVSAGTGTVGPAWLSVEVL